MCQSSTWLPVYHFLDYRRITLKAQLINLSSLLIFMQYPYSHIWTIITVITVITNHKSQITVITIIIDSDTIRDCSFSVRDELFSGWDFRELPHTKQLRVHCWTFCLYLGTLSYRQNHRFITPTKQQYCKSCCLPFSLCRYPIQSRQQRWPPCIWDFLVGCLRQHHQQPHDHFLHILAAGLVQLLGWGPLHMDSGSS